MKFSTAFLAPLTALLLSGCAVPLIGPLTLSHLSTIASATSMTIEGKGAAEVALDLATGKDCRMMEGFLRADRQLCEKPGSEATEGDFKGVIALLADKPPKSKATGDTMLAQAPAAAAPPGPGRAVRALKRVRPESVASLDTAPSTLEADYAKKSAARAVLNASLASSQLSMLAAPAASVLPELVPLTP